MALSPGASFGTRDLADLAAELAALPAGTVIKVGTKTITLGSAGQFIMTGPLLQGVANNLSAAGSTQATALVLTAMINVVTSVASGSGVTLPNFGIGATTLVINTTGGNLYIFPPSGGVINALAANASFQLAAQSQRFVQVTATQYWTN